MRRVGPLADHDHTVVVEDDHFTSVGFLEDGGVKHLLRTSFGNQPAIETDNPRQMRRHPVEIVGGNDDGHSLMIDLVKKMDHVVPRTNIEPSGGLIEQDQLRISQQRAPEKNRLLLAAGELADMTITETARDLNVP